MFENIFNNKDLSLEEKRERIIEEYKSSGREEKDRLFREELKIGSKCRRYLGWAGTEVEVFKTYQGSQAILCPTNWFYVFRGNMGTEISSSEINFCDDASLLGLLPHWF
jgi:hypothetical protein